MLGFDALVFAPIGAVGTGPVTLPISPTTGYFLPSAANIGKQVYYVISYGNEREVGLGTLGFSELQYTVSRGLIKSTTGALLNITNSATIAVGNVGPEALEICNIYDSGTDAITVTDVITGGIAADAGVIDDLTFGGVQMPMSDSDAAKLLTLDGAGSAHWKFAALPNVVGVRLTLESGVAVSTTDQTAKTNLHLTPANDGSWFVALWDSSEAAWVLRDLSGAAAFNVSFNADVAAAAIQASTNYWAFLDWNAGSPRLRLQKWTGDLSPPALGSQNGIPVYSGNAAWRLQGMVKTTAATQLEDSQAAGTIANLYNQVPRVQALSVSSSHSYNGPARPWNNSTANRLTFVTCQTGMVAVTGQVGQLGGTTIPSAGVSIDTIADASSASARMAESRIAQFSRLDLARNWTVAPGFHYVQAIESTESNVNSGTFIEMKFEITVMR